MIVLASPLLEKTDYFLHDNWLKLRQKVNAAFEEKSLPRTLLPVHPSPEAITIILIDDRSILEIPGLFQGNRQVFAKAIAILNEARPKAIGLDVFFPAPSLDYPEHDKELAAAVAESGNTVLKAFRRDNLRMTPPFPELARNGIPAPVFFNSISDKSIRHVSLAFKNEAGNTYPSFTTELLRIFLQLNKKDIEFSETELVIASAGQKQTVFLQNGEYMLLNYDQSPRNFTTYSFADLYLGKVPEKDINGKLVIVGYGNSMTEEKLYTPIEGNQFSPFLNAIALKNLLTQSCLKPANPYISMFLAALILVAFNLSLLSALSPLILLLLGSIIGISLLASSLLLLSLNNCVFQIMPALSSLFASLLFLLGRKYYGELSEKLRIKSAFQHYVTASVVNEILKNPAKLNLHGEERDLTIFFSDIEGFTTLSEGMSPLDVVSLLNEYLSEMTEVIFKFDGLLDKYEGDAIMAVFGAPVDQKDHAIRACRCAIENQKALRRLREKWKKEGKPEIKARIGINTGIVVVGNMGSKMRFDYTVIGDNVNLAARLETANKMMATEILVSETTALLAESAVISRCLGSLKAAGKTTQVKIYEVLADKNDTDKALVARCEQAKTAYETALNLMLDFQFQAAEEGLQKYLKKFPDDKPAGLLLQRIKGYHIVPPPPGWEFVLTQETK